MFFVELEARTSSSRQKSLEPLIDCCAGVCQVYAVIVNQNPGAGLVPTTGGAVISGDNQVDANLDPLPVTSGAYPTVTYASCNGCPNGPTTCG
uniref:Secreted protein n=1 Tax=Bursaphelenchus xylophilus TaxID=6326 RepID=A0A1I7SA18_BURXY